MVHVAVAGAGMLVRGVEVGPRFTPHLATSACERAQKTVAQTLQRAAMPRTGIGLDRFSAADADR